ncbi:MAG: 4-hydroxy-3-methylbut-2-enyl diphosphate reductase [Spirochaetaceae bacterium]|nr:4-hydroxy-3-methylbut-2-enyl diphosphate reductase [Spirochaetaceae bacterium]MCF7951533.1 4-hydroxy-3-methylbut-2-enyl diphosphate reductase [Spirochaetaceae bacterium]
MGVRAAMNKVERAADSAGPHDNISTYGPLIHNAQAIKKLAARGVGQVNNPDEVGGGTVVIRAHGVPKEIYERLKERCVKVINGTCPRVLRSMKVVDEFCRNGCHVILVGDPNHGEVEAIASYSDDIAVVENVARAEEIDVLDNTMVIAQTTISQMEYDAVCEVLARKNPNITIVQSICPATQERQTALERLAAEVESIVVIGGKNSSNTKRLYNLAVRTGKPSWHIENADELPGELSVYTSIGVTAGASTPDWVIDEVEKKLREM